MQYEYSGGLGAGSIMLLNEWLATRCILLGTHQCYMYVDGQKLGISAINVQCVGMYHGHESCEPGIECECGSRKGEIR